MITSVKTTAFDDFADLLRWLAYRSEERNGRTTKIPYSPHGGPEKANDPNTWATRREAEAYAKKISGGIGIVLGDIGNDIYLCGLDLDSCLHVDKMAPWADAILDVIDSY